MKNKIEKIMDDPIDDTEMKTYIGQDAKILKHSALKNLKHIDELMPNATDFVVRNIPERRSLGERVKIS